jgi:hypothetical protein
MSQLVNGIPHIYNGVVILCRGDGYWNATAMCQANGKRWNNYYRNQETQEFLAALSEQLDLPVARIRATGTASAATLGLIDTVQGGPPVLQGTWVHRRVALNLAQWCSPTFAVRVTGWVEELLTKGRVELPEARARPQVRAWSERITPAFEAHKLYIVQNCPVGAWSVLTAALGETLLTEDELVRHCLPIAHHNLPDGSMGQKYRDYREGKWWAGRRLSAPLILPKWRKIDGADVEVQVAVYEADERRYFEDWLSRCYFREHLPAYLEYKFPQRQYGLTSASAADNSSRRITGRRAVLPANILRIIDSSEGRYIPAHHALGRPPRQQLLFDDSAE